MQHQNGYLQDRNIYVVDGQVMFVSRYHKSQALFGAPKVVPRFLPWKVGLLGVYLTHVEPFKEEVRPRDERLPRSESLEHGTSDQGDDAKNVYSVTGLTLHVTR